MHCFKIGVKFVKAFLIQTYILSIFDGKRSKVILFSKIKRFLRSTTQGSRRTDLALPLNNVNAIVETMCM